MADEMMNKELEKTVADCAGIARILWEKGWAEGNAGNISVDVTTCVPTTLYNFNRFPFTEREIGLAELSGRSFLVSGTGSRMRDLAVDPHKNAFIMRIVESLDGYHTLWGGHVENGGEPTSEIATHLVIHQFLQRIGSRDTTVIHTHPTELIALTHKAGVSEAALNRILWAMHPETKVLVPAGVGVVPYGIPGSDALAASTVKALGNHSIAVWEMHGCVAVGPGLHETLDLIDVANKSAAIFLLCKGSGMEPEGLTAEQIAELEGLAGQGRNRGE
jgi:rhamnulose-1-phosphate aldolase